MSTVYLKTEGLDQRILERLMDALAPVVREGVKVQVEVPPPPPSIPDKRGIHLSICSDEINQLWSAVSGKPGLEKLRDRLVETVRDLKEEPAEKYRQAAQRLHNRDGECEIDDNATVSVSDDGGAYVLGWMWVTDREAGVDRE
jgi:hypothetical protein